MEQGSGRAKARERKYVKGFAKKVTQDLDTRPNNEDPPPPTPQELEGWVLAQQLTRNVGQHTVRTSQCRTNEFQAFSINDPDEPIIRKYIWDLGLRGSKQTDLFEELLHHFLITPCPENAGRIEKVKVSGIYPDPQLITH